MAGAGRDVAVKAAYTVGLKRYVPGATNAHGNPRDTWSAPVDLPVYAIAPRFSTEPDPSRPGGIVVGLTLLAPPDALVGGRDRIVIDGDDYEVEGDHADWNRGPFDWRPGNSINLRRVKG